MSVRESGESDAKLLKLSQEMQGTLSVSALGRLQTQMAIAARHLFSRKLNLMITSVALIAVVGVALGVTTMNFAVSVMSGFQYDLRDKILGANAHAVVLGQPGEPVRDASVILGLTDAMPDIKGAAPFVYGEALLRVPNSRQYTGIIIKGVDVERTPAVTSLVDDLLVDGSGALTTPEAKLASFKRVAEPVTGPAVPDVYAYNAVLKAEGEAFIDLDAALGQDADIEIEPGDTQDTTQEFPGIIIGAELAQSFQVGPGSELHLMDPLGGAPGPMGIPTPRVVPVRVVSVYKSGMYEYDNKWTYLNNAELQKFLRMGDSVTGVELALHDVYQAEEVAAELGRAVGPMHFVRHWKQMNRQLFEALEMERIYSALLFFLILTVCSFLVASAVMMRVLTKGKEIAVLRAMGSSPGDILGIFVFEGVLLGVIGTVVGTVAGLSLALGLDYYGLPLSTDVYMLSTVPVHIDVATVAYIAIGALVVSFVITIIPSFIASRLNPVEGLRYE